MTSSSRVMNQIAGQMVAQANNDALAAASRDAWYWHDQYQASVAAHNKLIGSFDRVLDRMREHGGPAGSSSLVNYRIGLLSGVDRRELTNDTLSRRKSVLVFIAWAECLRMGSTEAVAVIREIGSKQVRQRLDMAAKAIKENNADMAMKQINAARNLTDILESYGKLAHLAVTSPKEWVDARVEILEKVVTYPSRVCDIPDAESIPAVVPEFPNVLSDHGIKDLSLGLDLNTVVRPMGVSKLIA